MNNADQCYIPPEQTSAVGFYTAYLILHCLTFRKQTIVACYLIICRYKHLWSITLSWLSQTWLLSDYCIHYTESRSASVSSINVLINCVYIEGDEQYRYDFLKVQNEVQYFVCVTTVKARNPNLDQSLLNLGSVCSTMACTFFGAIFVILCPPTTELAELF